MSTAEVERVMSTLKRILSEKRTAMTDKHLEACVMISHESRRRYGVHEKWRITELQPLMKNELAKKRVQKSKKSRRID